MLLFVLLLKWTPTRPRLDQERDCKGDFPDRGTLEPCCVLWEGQDPERFKLVYFILAPLILRCLEATGVCRGRHWMLILWLRCQLHCTKEITSDAHCSMRT